MGSPIGKGHLFPANTVSTPRNCSSMHVDARFCGITYIITSNTRNDRWTLMTFGLSEFPSVGLT